MPPPPHNAPHPTAKPVVGLLGAPGSGKSFVARIMAEHGAAVIDADRLARHAINDVDIREQLRDWWGPDVIDSQSQVDRQAVARIVFNDPAQLRRLESLIHPRVHEQRHALRARYDADPAVTAIVEDCPLLLEQDLARDCDLLVFVSAPRAVREQRVRARGWSPEELAMREKNQASLDIKQQAADYVVDNGEGEALVREQVRRLFSQILQGQEPLD